MNAGVGGGVAAFFGLDDADVVAEGGFELGIGLLAQLITVTEEECRFGQFAQPAPARQSRLVAMMVLPEPVASVNSTRAGSLSWQQRIIFSKAARMAAS